MQKVFKVVGRLDLTTVDLVLERGLKQYNFIVPRSSNEITSAQLDQQQLLPPNNKL